MSISYELLPMHMREGFRLYIERGIPGGSFMNAVLSNDLMGAFGRADDINSAAMFNICCFIRNEAPMGCHGSAEQVHEWTKSGGLAVLAPEMLP
jgi:hypothetical protein